MIREDAISILKRKSTIPDDDYCWDEIEEAFNMAIESIENQPIHCKDCEFYNTVDYSDNGECTLFGFDTMFGFRPSSNWFCGSAKIKENN